MIGDCSIGAPGSVEGYGQERICSKCSATEDASDKENQQPDGKSSTATGEKSAVRHGRFGVNADGTPLSVADFKSGDKVFIKGKDGNIEQVSMLRTTKQRVYFGEKLNRSPANIALPLKG